MTNIELALVELNAKYQVAVTHADAYISDVDSDEWAYEKCKADIERIEKLADKKIHFDGNYSRTWGFNMYGIYKTWEEMCEISEIVETGF